jgi:hypothetical protein
MDLQDALAPFPMKILPLLLSGSVEATSDERAQQAADAWSKGTGEILSPTALAVAIDRLELAFPELFQGARHCLPTSQQCKPMPTWHTSCPCGHVVCPHGFRPASFWSLAAKPQHTQVSVGRCSRCDRKFLGPWCFRTPFGSQGAMSNLMLLRAPGPAEDLLLFSSKRVLVIEAPVLRMIVGAFDHCRGSFQGALRQLAEIVDMDSFDTSAHREELTCGYAVYSTLRFFDEPDLLSLTWPGNLLCRNALDEFLLEHESKMRQVLCQRWGIDHRCPRCADGFLLGIDGKHGARRFTCAWPGGSVKFVPSLGIHVREPCSKRAQLGGAFCQEHGGVDAAACAEKEDDSGTWRVLRKRTSGRAADRLNGDAPEIEYEVECTPADGETWRMWAPLPCVAPELIRDFEGRCPQRVKDDPVCANSTNKRSVSGLSVSSAKKRLVDNVLQDDADEDSEQCHIDKTLQHKKKRSRGGIVACVTSCQLFVGWKPYHGGEGLSDVYMSLAEVCHLLQQGRWPLAIFYDNACALRTYARKPRRQQLSSTSAALASSKFLLDKWHRCNHTRCLMTETSRAAIDPKHEANVGLANKYNTEACEQAFSWLDRYVYSFLELGAGLFQCQMTFLMDRRNRRIVTNRSC